MEYFGRISDGIKGEFKGGYMIQTLKELNLMIEIVSLPWAIDSFTYPPT